jgi:hypothetical protein
MAHAMCKYTIPAAVAKSGGRLEGGFPSNSTKILTGESLVMTVHWAGPNAPTNLTGYFTFTASPTAPPNQTNSSPFVEAANGSYRCFIQQAAKGSGNGPADYDFTPLNYSGGYPGYYELTFVAEAGTGTAAAIQWSADPEFETGN